MSFWFKKKKMIQALAEVLENGREKMDQEMQKGKYKTTLGQSQCSTSQFVSGRMMSHLLKPK